MDLRTEAKNSKKKRRVPLFDIVLLLLTALALIGGSYWVTHREQTPTVELEYTIRFSGVDNAYSGTLSAEKTLYTASGVPLGEIRSASVSRAVEYGFDGSTQAENGEYRYTENVSSVKSDVAVTVRVTAEKRDGGYFVEGVRIAAGAELEAMVTGYLGEGEILTVKELPAEMLRSAEEKEA